MLRTTILTASGGWKTLVVPTTPIEFWTLALTIATVALAAVAFFGLRAVALSKKDMTNRTTREAAQCTIDRCNEMARELIPMYLDILAGLTAQKVPMFVHDVGEVSFEKNEETEKINDAIAWMGKVDSALLNKTVQRRANLESGPYQNIVTLFRGWYARKAQDAMLEQLMRMQSEGPMLPKAIGEVP